MPLLLRAPLPLIAALAVGCTTPVVDDVADANAAMTDGVVLVERSVSADGAAQTYVSAKFMRLSTPVDPDLAERMVGSTLDLPEVGTCRRTAAERMNGQTRALGSPGAIELIDVGDVTLRTGSSVMTLAARAFPDVGDMVSGMFYTSRDSSSDLPMGATYLLEGTGSLSGVVERFAIEAEAPAAPEDVRVGDTALGDAPVIGASASAILRWSTASTARAARADKGQEDQVFIDVSAQSGASVRCAFRDTGRATVPAWVFGAATLGPLPATATLSMHRVRERSFVVSGLDAGTVRFDLSMVGKIFVTMGETPKPLTRPSLSEAEAAQQQ